MSSLIADKLPGPSLSLCNIRLQADKLQILEEISCEFAAGQWHAVIGPNGGGKSTLLKAILGLTAHTGNIKIHWPEESGRIGYLPQQVPFDSSLPISVRDYLLMSLTRKPVWFKRGLPSEVEEALNQVRLEEKLDRKIGDLSGGERQRLMLTTALLQRPQLLILDEPMTGLDEKGREESLSLLKQFRDAGGTLLMVEHDWQVVEQYCDQVYWINQRLLHQNEPTAFFQANAHQVTPSTATLQPIGV